jgi:biopolymer transport protein ExbD
MRLSRKSNRETFALDLTTCSDIIFTLLIFYILTQSFVVQVPVDLPKLESEVQNISSTAQRIEIAESGGISWNDETLPPDWKPVFTKKLASMAPDSSFVIVAHHRAPAGVAIELLDRLRLNGIGSVAFGGIPEKTEKTEP